MIKFEEKTYKEFGRCMRMYNDYIELYATLDFGPRIIHFSKLGGENMMFNDPERSFNQDKNKELFAEKFGEDLGTWKIYGGHRLWTSPEGLPRSYYPDNQPVEFIAEGNTLTLIPPAQRYNQQQHQIKIVMSEDSGKVDLYHSIQNIGAWPQKFAPWCLSVLSAGGTEVIPMPNRKTHLLHNRKITLWDYTKMNDSRVYWGDKYITLTQDKNGDGSFKIGLDSQHGWAAYFNHNDLLIKHFDVVEGAEYPDDGMNFETYTNPLFLEMESLGVYSSIEPGDCATHHESLEIVPDIKFPGIDEDKLCAILDGLV